MTFRRRAAATTVVVMAALSVFSGATAAQADDYNLTIADLNQPPTSPYPGWRLVSGPLVPVINDLTGLRFEATSAIIATNTAPGDVSAGLAAVGATARLRTSSPTPKFFISIWPRGLIAPVELYATPYEIAADTWRLDGDMFDLDPAFVTLSTHSLAEYEAAFSDGYEILDFGFRAFGELSVHSISWNGDTYSFMPVPTIALGPTTTSPAASAATGVIVSATGFLPGEPVTLSGPGGVTFATVTADVNGAVAGTFIAGSPLGEGSYDIGALGTRSAARVATTFLVAEGQAVAAPAGQLATTGSDPAPPAVVVGTLFLVGTLAVAFAARRRQTSA